MAGWPSAQAELIASPAGYQGAGAAAAGGVVVDESHLFTPEPVAQATDERRTGLDIAMRSAAGGALARLLSMRGATWLLEREQRFAPSWCEQPRPRLQLADCSRRSNGLVLNCGN